MPHTADRVASFGAPIVRLSRPSAHRRSPSRERAPGALAILLTCLLASANLPFLMCLLMSLLTSPSHERTARWLCMLVTHTHPISLSVPRSPSPLAAGAQVKSSSRSALPFPCVWISLDLPSLTSAHTPVRMHACVGACLYPHVQRTMGWARVILRSILWPKSARMSLNLYLIIVGLSSDMPHAMTETPYQVKSSQVKSSQVKSRQVKASQGKSRQAGPQLKSRHVSSRLVSSRLVTPRHATSRHGK